MGRRQVSTVDDVVINSERRGAPMVIHLEVVLRRAVSLVDVAAALRSVGRRHPAAVAQLAPARFWDRARAWLGSDEALDFASAAVVPLVEPDLERARDQFYSATFPLTQRPAVMIGVWSDAEVHRLMFRGHHGALDGRGLLIVIEEVLATLLGLGPPSASTAGAHAGHLGLDGVADAEDPVARVEDVPGRQRSRFAALREVVAGPIPERVAEPPGHESVDVARSGVSQSISSIAADPSIVAALSSRPPEVTVNDLLVAGAHLAVAEWNRGAGRSAERITVTVPFDLRDPDDQRVGNLSSQCSTASDTELRADPAALVASIHATVSEHRSGRATDPSVTVGALSWVPLGLRRMLPRVASVLTRDRFLDTLRLSNLGVVSGPIWDHPEVMAVGFSAPTRMPQGASIAVVSHGGSVFIGLRWCLERFDREAATAFGDCYLESLGRLCASLE